jgi:cytochrome c-type biogenesis protein
MEEKHKPSPRRPFCERFIYIMTEIQKTPSAHDTQSPPPDRRLLIFVGIAVVLVGVIIAILSMDSGENTAMMTGRTVTPMLAVFAFFAGLLSFLSPCTLPILPAYFAFSFQSNQRSIVTMTIAFFMGLATTMTLVGTGFTALGSLVSVYRDALTFWGGILIIIFGLMSIFGKGFAGPQMADRPIATTFGSYLYGATFALGWTACIGPILGALLTLLASQGIAILQGAVLSFIYSLGLGMPLIVLSTFFSKLGSGSRFWKILRGKGFEVKVGPWLLYLHSTSIISGVLLIVLGLLLASNQLILISSVAQDNPLFKWFEEIYFDLSMKFNL